MASFSIDEVRESFQADMTQLLAEIGAAARALESSLATLPPPPQDTSGRPFFEAVAARAHAVAGTGSLVGASSLAESARRLEALGRDGQIALDRAREQFARALQVARLCGEGAKAMEGMLALELDHRRAEADEAAAGWLGRAKVEPVAELRTEDLEMLADVGADARAAEGVDDSAQKTGEFSFEEDGAVPVPPAAGGREFSFEGEASAPSDEMDELKGIFQRELRDSLPTLRGQLEALRARPDDLAAAEQIERIYHTLKGASATVGLAQVSQLAASLQQRLEQCVEAGTGLPPGLLADLVQDTDRLLELSGLAPGPAAPSAREEAVAGPSGAADSPAELFVREAREILEEASRLAVELPAAAAEDAGRTREELGRLLHHLKGSSLVAGDVAAADAAAELQARCEGGVALDAAALTAGLKRLGAMIGAPGALPSDSRSGPASRREEIQVEREPELWEAFHQECTELLEGIEKDVLALEDAEQPRRLLQSLMRQHHTLKGAANSVGLAPTGRLLHRVEDFLEGLLEAPLLPPMKEVADFLLQVQVEVRKHLATAPQGFVVSSLDHVDTRIRQVISGARVGQPSAGPAADDSRPSAGGGGTGSSVAVASAAEKRFIRVAAEQLDSLMNLAGALVVSRSRLATRVSTMHSVQRDLGRSQRRLVAHVEEFVEKHEFDNLDGRSRAARRAQEREEASFGQFGALELDRYDDVHVLSRSLAEVSDDLGEVFGQLFREMAGIADDADVFGTIVSGIQREVTRARMVPLENVFTRLRLPVRDAAAREQKEVRVAVSGEDVHLDKAIADALFQPMLHLVRNAVVHGIETEVGREAAGKPRAGTIRLGARQESGQIVLEVGDDGRGLDLAALHARGVAMGVLPPEAPLTDPAVKDLVFAPGLSTSAEAGMVSGRGFGCDVVRRAIERLNGSIRVETSPTTGTTFTITLPLTLAITRALLVRHADRLYALPLHFAEHIFELGETRVIESLGARRMKLGDSFVLVRSLGDIFGTGEKARLDGPVLVLRVGEQRVALQIDAVVAQEEIVVKSLGELLQGHPVLAGVTVRGNGELVLIVDVPGVVERIGPVPSAPRAAPVPGAAPPPEAGEPAAGSGARDEARPPGEPAGRPPEPTPLTTPPPPAALAGRGPPLRVLFVDDSISVRKVAERALQGLGVDVVVAADGLDALEKLRGQDFDLVFTDLEMPRMHGYELIRELRFLPAYRDLPVVVVSSRSGQKHRDEARNLGATDYLTKPFNAEALDGALIRWVPRRTAAANGQDPR